MTTRQNSRLLLTTMVVSLIVPFVAAVGLSAAEPLFEKATVFSAGDQGYRTYRIPGLVATKSGALLAYCEARRTAGDWASIDVVLRRSEDGGKTWLPQRKIVDVDPKDVVQNRPQGARRPEDSDDVTVNNPVAVVDRDSGDVHFLYCVEYGRCYYMRSTDDGKSFSPPVDITPTFEGFRADYDWKVLATGPGHGIQTASGRLIVPVWLSTGTGGGGHRPSAVSVIFSDDHGRTWRRGEIVVAHPHPINPSETVAVELADGRVMLNIRHEGKTPDEALRHRAVVVSDDGATGWSKPRYDDALPEPICMASIARLTQQPHFAKNRIVFAQPHNPVDRTRKNVSVKLSYDEGQSWPVMRTIEPAGSGYSDLAVGPDKTIYCLYEDAGSASVFQPQQLTLARFNLAWLTDGKDELRPSGGSR
ncbi:MAG: exo-alpha-sialidase [Planctomycetales bacterium]|nr:exo-alpha-sialidase [Planctomycetales bacterium]